MGDAYRNKADRATIADDWDRCMNDLALVLPHYREAARIYRAINHVDAADRARRNFDEVEDEMRQVRIASAAAAGSRG